MTVTRNQLWQIVRDTVSTYEDEDKWEFDGIWLAANWGYCYLQGKHPKTSEEEWVVLDEIMTKGEYSEINCKRLFDLLCDERLDTLIESMAW
jgi:hypothetical protein